MFPVHTLKLLYYALFESHLLYCCEIWGNCAKKYLHEILIIQKKTIQFICKQDYKAHTVPLFKTLKILPVDNLVMHRLCVLCHELTHDIGPPVLKFFIRISPFIITILGLLTIFRSVKWKLIIKKTVLCTRVQLSGILYQ